jgi:hypothetical protein
MSTFCQPFLRKKLDAKGDVVDPETAQALTSILDALVQTIEDQNTRDG